jgi:transcriptional regulator with XRE-family HTH domain
MAGRAARIERALEQGVALACVSDAVCEPRERRRLARVLRQLRREIGLSVPKRRVAAILGVTVPALERWIERGRLPVVRKPGLAREEIDADAVFDLAVEVTRLREQGVRRGVLAAAFERLAERGGPRPKLRPNESPRDLREFYEQTTPLERLRIGSELSVVGTTLAARGAAAREEGRS